MLNSSDKEDKWEEITKEEITKNQEIQNLEQIAFHNQDKESKGNFMNYSLEGTNRSNIIQGRNFNFSMQN